MGRRGTSGRAPLPLLLLPGFDGSGRLFGPLLEAGPCGVAPRVVPLPGDEPLGYEPLLPRLADALPRTGSYALLAESFSGPLAMRLAAARPPGLTHLILAATFVRRPVQRWLQPVAARAGETFFRLPLPGPALRLLMAGLDAPAALVETARQAMRELPAAVAAARARAALEVEAGDDLARVEVPVLWLAPAHDRFLRTDHDADARAALPAARVVRLPTPHMVLQRAPHASLLALEAFLAGEEVP